MNDFDGLGRYGRNLDNFYQREGGFFHANMALHIFDSFGLDDPAFFVAELFDSIHKVMAARRNTTYGLNFYFGGVKKLRISIFYQAFAIDRKKMTAAGIAIKYRVSQREVHRALASVGYVQHGGWRR